MVTPKEKAYESISIVSRGSRISLRLSICVNGCPFASSSSGLGMRLDLHVAVAERTQILFHCIMSSSLMLISTELPLMIRLIHAM